MIPNITFEIIGGVIVSAVLLLFIVVVVVELWDGFHGQRRKRDS